MTAHDETRRLAPNGTSSPHKVHYRKPHASGNGVASGRTAEEGINTSGVTINIDSETDKRKQYVVRITLSVKLRNIWACHWLDEAPSRSAYFSQLNSEQKELLYSINRFQRKIKKGFIDVW